MHTLKHLLPPTSSGLASTQLLPADAATVSLKQSMSACNAAEDGYMESQSSSRVMTLYLAPTYSLDS